MKIATPYRGLLLGVILGFLPNFTAHAFDHDNLQFSADIRRWTFVDPRDPSHLDDASKVITVAVTWSIKPPAANTNIHEYDIEISILDYQGKPVPSDKEKIYSLLTLGFQSINTVREITENKTTDDGIVQYIPAGSTQPISLKPYLALSPTGKIWDARARCLVIAEDNIGFLRFYGSKTGVYKLTVREIPRDRVGVTIWYPDIHVGSGHDNNPPTNPPD